MPAGPSLWRVAPASVWIQSCTRPSGSSIDRHSAVVGGGGSTPHRRVIAGSPHAVEDWELVERRSRSPRTSGVACRTSPHSGADAVGAGSSETGVPHAPRSKEARDVATAS